MNGELASTLNFIIYNLISHQIDVLVEEFGVEFHQNIVWFSYYQRLCIDVKVIITSISASVDTDLQLVECTKVLIDNMEDFGQSDFEPEWEDEINKPFTKFAKFFDECEYTYGTSLTVKEFSQDEFELYLVGDGSDDLAAPTTACFPGDVWRPIIYVYG